MGKRAVFNSVIFEHPPAGTEGEAWESNGFDDPESPEYRTYCFMPDDAELDEDGNKMGFYCSKEDFEWR